MKKYLKGIITLAFALFIFVPFVVKAEEISNIGIGNDHDSIVFEELEGYSKYGMTISNGMGEDVYTGTSNSATFSNIMNSIKAGCDANKGLCTDDYGQIYEVFIYGLNANDEKVDETESYIGIDYLRNPDMIVQVIDPHLQLINDTNSGTYTVEWDEMPDEYKGERSSSLSTDIPYRAELVIEAKPKDGKLFVGWFEADPDTLQATDNVMSGSSKLMLFADPGVQFINVIAVYADANDESLCRIIIDTNGGDMRNFPVPTVVPCGFATTLGQLDEGHVGFPYGYEFEAYEIDGERREVGEDITIDKDINAKLLWKDVSKNVALSVADGDYNISFVGLNGHDYDLSMIDIYAIVNATDDELLDIMGVEDHSAVTPEMVQVIRDQVNTTIETIKTKIASKGTFINLYAINLFDVTEGRDLHNETTFDVKIKATDEMKQYDTVSLVFIDDDNNYEIGEVITLKLEGDYYVGTLPHLSAYVLVGSNNPNTVDNIYTYLTMFIIGVVGFAGTAILLKKNY